MGSGGRLLRSLLGHRWMALARGSHSFQHTRGLRMRQRCDEQPVERTLHARSTEPSVSTSDDAPLRLLHHAVLSRVSRRATGAFSIGTHPANHARTSPTLAYHVASASPDPAARDTVDARARPGVRLPLLETSIQRRSQSQRRISAFILAAQSLLDELFSELQEVRPELSTRARKLVERVEIDVARELRDDAVGWLVVSAVSPP